jgi:hypothetical protein
MGTFIGVTKKKGSIKVVEYLGDGEIEYLGIELYDYFKDISESKLIVKTTVDFIEDGEIEFYTEFEDDGDSVISRVYEEYINFKDLEDSVDFSDDLYYIYDGSWKVIGKQFETLTELEFILDEGN